ncbi:hypothetical protein OROMI_014819 [Orobanche minor]
MDYNLRDYEKVVNKLQECLISIDKLLLKKATMIGESLSIAMIFKIIPSPDTNYLLR